MTFITTRKPTLQLYDCEYSSVVNVTDLEHVGKHPILFDSLSLQPPRNRSPVGDGAQTARALLNHWKISSLPDDGLLVLRKHTAVWIRTATVQMDVKTQGLECVCTLVRVSSLACLLPACVALCVCVCNVFACVQRQMRYSGWLSELLGDQMTDCRKGPDD